MAIGVSAVSTTSLGWQITVTGANSYDFIRVTRVDNTSYYDDAIVRGFDMVAPTGSTMIVDDDEAPFNTSLNYRAEGFMLSNLVTPASSATAGPYTTTVPFGFALIADVLDTGSRVHGAVPEEGLRSWDIDGNVKGTYKVLGRKNPVVITDTAGSRSGSLKMTNIQSFTTQYDATGPHGALYSPYLGRWNSIFNAGSTLLFRNDHNTTGFDDLYFKVQSVTATRIGRISTEGVNTPTMDFDIKYVEVDRPATSIEGLGLYTWQTILDSNVDWTDVNATHATWADVLANPTA